MYRVELTESAREFFDDAHADFQRRLDRCFDILKQTPRFHPNIKPLKGAFRGMLRYRIGEYRVVYRIDDTNQVVWVEMIALRRDVYE